MNQVLTGGGIIGMIVILFLIVLAILWFILPFAIFGTKPRLDELIAETKKTNTWLQEIAIELRKSNPSEPPQQNKGRHISFDRPGE